MRGQGEGTLHQMMHNMHLVHPLRRRSDTVGTGPQPTQAYIEEVC